MLNALKKLEALFSKKPLSSSKSPPAHKPKEARKPKKAHKPKEAHLPKRDPGFSSGYLDTFTEEDWIWFKYLQRHLPSFINVITATTPQALTDEMEQSLMAMNTGRPLSNYQKLLISVYFICPIPTLEIPEIAIWLIEYAAKKSLSSKPTLNEIPQKHNSPT